MKRIIHINQHKIRSNAKDGINEPVLTCKTSKQNIYGYEVEFTGGGKVVYSPDKPLSCGAKFWIETHNEIHIKTDNGTVTL